MRAPPQSLNPLRTHYRFVEFIDMGKRWNCVNRTHRKVLGSCTPYAAWRQWVFSQSGPDCIFSADCLRDIADFLEQLNRENKP